jgi:hypothetical protein
MLRSPNCRNVKSASAYDLARGVAKGVLSPAGHVQDSNKPMTTVMGVTTEQICAVLTFFRLPKSRLTLNMLPADENAARRFKTNMAIQSVTHPLNPLFRAIVGVRTDTRLPSVTAATPAASHHIRVAAADSVIAAVTREVREPIDDSQCPAGTQDAIEQLEAASADARQLAHAPFAVTTDYLRPVSWSGFQ